MKGPPRYYVTCGQLGRAGGDTPGYNVLPRETQRRDRLTQPRPFSAQEPGLARAYDTAWLGEGGAARQGRHERCLPPGARAKPGGLVALAVKSHSGPRFTQRLAPPSVPQGNSSAAGGLSPSVRAV